MDQNQNGMIDESILLELARMKMPFGKYAGRVLCDLPEPYLVWFSRKGFPKGRIGLLLETLFEMKVNGLEYLLKPMKMEQPPKGKPNRTIKFEG